MSNIQFSNFSTKFTNLNAIDAQIAKDKLSEKLNTYLIDKISGSKKEFLAGKLKAIYIDVDSAKGQPMASIVNDIMVNNFSTDNEVKELLSDLSERLKNNAVTIDNLLGLNLPLKENHIFREDYYKAKATAYGDIISLPETVIKKLSDQLTDIDDIDEPSLQKLVDDQSITPSQKSGLQLVVDFSRLSGENLDFIKALHSYSVKIEDFIDFDIEDWKKLLIGKHIPIPSNEKSVEDYAKSLVKGMEMSFPQTFFLNRVIYKKDFTNQLKTFDAFDNIKHLGKIHFKGPEIVLDNINWAGVNETEKNALLKDLDQLQEFSYSYRYLDITKILAQEEIDLSVKKDLVQKRLEQLKAFYNKNERIDFAKVDFFNPASKFDYSGVAQENRPLIKAQAMAFQRMLNLGEKAKTAQLLLSKGFSSSWEIVHKGEADFVKRIGVPLNEAKHLYTTALDNITATGHFVQAIRDAKRGGFNYLTSHNIQPMINELRQIDGYDQMFGNQNYCECDHCKSIFSPAAYFTDLMLFVEKNITQKIPQFSNANSQHPLKLYNRRRDLWTLPLTCQNTTTEIPYLDVVNDVLERYIKPDQPNDKVYRELSESDASCNLPFNLPLSELRTYLGHFDLSLSQIYKLLGEDGVKLKQEQLRLSDKELSLIGVPDLDRAFVRFGSPDLNNLSVSEFIRLANISRSDLDAIINLKAKIDLLAIEIQTIDIPGDIQQYREIFKPGTLTKKRLDLSQRFLRLCKSTPWTIQEFDMVLMVLYRTNTMLRIEDKDQDQHYKFLILADVITIQNALKLNIEELYAVIGAIPDFPLNINGKSLYERLFNLKEIFGINPVTNRFNTQVSLTNIKSDDKITPHILAGLSISELELNMLFKQLLINNVDAPVTITGNIISRLYRHCRLASGLKLGIENLVAAINIINGGHEMKSISEMILLLETKKAIDNIPLDFKNINFILNGVENTVNKYSFDGKRVKDLVKQIQDTPIQPGVTKIDLLKIKIQSLFGISGVGLTENILKLASIDIEDQSITAALNSDLTDLTTLNPILTILKDLERKIFCFGRFKLEDIDVSFLISNPTIFGITDIKAWTFADIRTIALYADLLNSQTEETKENLREEFLIIDQSNFHLLESGINLFSSLWSCSSTLIYSILDSFSFVDNPINIISKIHELVLICQKLGIQAGSLIKLKTTDYSSLVAARDVVYGAFASKYADEKVRAEKLEAYHDKINTQKRNALCGYIIAQHDTLKFKDRADLYYFFLLDVEMSGCFRTSQVLAAISSVQLYVQRCLQNLEQSGTSNIRVDSSLIPVDEWEWRKNYRVWEANRKVFLYPENYIDPALRSSKTPPFKELEDELLQQNITLQTAEAAYKKYMAEFLKLSNLRYAGAYYHHVNNFPVTYVNVSLPGSTNGNSATMKIGDGFTWIDAFLDKEKTIYYLFARTNLEPYEYYFRTFNQFKKLWGHWIAIDLPIESEKVSAIIHNGVLFIYWTEVQHQEITNITGGNANVGAVIFKVTAKYSTLDLDGKWNSPQRIYLGTVKTSYPDIFGRVDENFELDVDNKDSIVAKYKMEVFSQPYLSRTALCEELELRHIYSPGIGVYNNEITFRTKEQFIWAGKVPPLEFVIKDGNFNDAPEREVSIYLPGNPDPDNRWIVKIRSPNLATLQFKGGSIFPKYLPLEVETVLQLETVTTTTYAQDINNYIKEPNISFTNIDANALGSGLDREFIYSNIRDGSYMHYVEDGTRDFMFSEKVISQIKQGQAQLIFPSTNSQSGLQELSTILSNELTNILIEKGLQSFLSIQTQNSCNTAGQLLNFTSSYGAYYWEMFFHIPFLIANSLNANQNFKEAKWWYERIFNPTSSERPTAGNSGEHYWQFREFRNLDIIRLKDILTDESTIAIYKKDPFDPHAIAALRISAYQKSIVMKYIDNLLDWGDYLFTQDTQESLVEADMLYQLAQDILGKRPEKIGKCKTEDEESLTFEKIAEAINDGSEFLINVENLSTGVRNLNNTDKVIVENSKYLSKLLENLGETNATPNKLSELAVLSKAKYKSDLKEIFDPIIPAVNLGRPAIMRYSVIKALNYLPVSYAGKNYSDINESENEIIYNYEKGNPIIELTDQSRQAFCVPVNADLLQYWDRVEDRLFKVRNCMNISGVRRSLDLFQPAADTMLLVKAKASGISLEEIDSSLNLIDIPNYRFNFMLEKARQFAQNVQGFGAALLSALEKKDGEELTLIRSIHEKNILGLSKDIKRRQVDEAQKQYNALEDTITNIKNRIEYYQSLIDEGLTGWEITEEFTRHAATKERISEGVFRIQASIAYLLPQIGSPFSMNYGGQQIGDSFNEIAQMSATFASIMDSVSASAGLEASFQRRKEEWNFQLKTASQDLQQSTKQLLASDLRLKIAERDQEIHNKTIEQSSEAFDFLKNKFTNLSLYNYMSTTLNRLYRDSYSVALGMAKAAERCYSLELYDDQTFIKNDNWENNRAGLMAGERLLLQLNRMEQSYLNMNKRCPEITQSFSLALIDPLALITLKQKGICNIVIPEIAYEILYPGQFGLLIQGVKVSVPCVAGPFTNISAQLTLKESKIRINVDSEPLRMDTDNEEFIVTSSALNDSGTFEFNFRDERYLPFENKGAISKWELSLPSKIRSFNYNTISDVILHISYKARYGDRVAGETNVLNKIKEYSNSTESPGLIRIISMKYEFADAFHKFLNNNNQLIDFEITNDHFLILSGISNLG